MWRIIDFPQKSAFTTHIFEPGDTWHIFKWVTNHEDCYKYLGTSAGDMERQLDSFATERRPLQAWNRQFTWIPAFDRADSYECTVYEDASVLNWFRGILPPTATA